MADTTLHVRSVAVIGAGVSGISAAVHLRRAGLDVTVYERTSRAGGVWVYDERSSKEAAYPSTLPSVGDSPDFERRCSSHAGSRHDSPIGTPGLEEGESRGKKLGQDLSLEFAPPGPCYVALKNNVSTIEMELSCQRWKPGTEEFVPHHVLADYIQDAAIENGVQASIQYDTRVNSVQKQDAKWRLEIATLDNYARVLEHVEHFDAVVVASGHYHAPNIPDIPGLSAWKKAFPDRNVLLIGAGVSSIDIARDLGTTARAVFQSSRGGPYDVPSHLLPQNGTRVGGIESFDTLESAAPSSDGSILATVTLMSGEKLCNIHKVVICTGYHASLPFLRQLHADNTPVEDADPFTLVTNGQVTHNLHKDIWYIPDPTLSFIGVPFHVATFSLFEFQAMALARVLAGKVSLPTAAFMRAEYLARQQRKGIGRSFHSLKGRGEEIAYVQDLVQFVNRGEDESNVMSSHSAQWLEAYQRRTQRQEALFSAVRDSKIEGRALALVPQC